MGILIKNATIVNEGKIFKGHVLIEKELIAKIFNEDSNITAFEKMNQVIDINGKYLLPGVIDDQVHFREPGLTHKATIQTESRAAVAGGITSFMEMPNTFPNTLTQELLQDKYNIAEKTSYANYSFYMGASNDNIDEVLKTDPKTVCGVKVFMGSSTGNMLVDNPETLEELFSKCKLLIAAHCEDEDTIKKNMAIYKEKYGEDVPVTCHPEIRNEEACYKSSSLAIQLAKKHNTRFHLFHLSTAKELGLLENKTPLKEKRITAEACVHHMWFSDEDYKTKGNFIKWNPAVKKATDRDAILQAVIDGTIDVIATDHAPHTLEEKNNTYFSAPSGGPLVQHALVAMLEHYHNGKISLEKMVEKMSHAVADCFKIENRGFIREGYFADFVVVDLNNPWTVNKDNLLYKCGWSPFEGTTFKSKVLTTIINGSVVYTNGKFNENYRGKRLTFNH
ncbi:MAG: dihydroorotase [Flavobacteriales bacterium]|nr:dihydroorotase [Flavobacteriales bacterium]